jgi:hypothetical protein
MRLAAPRRAAATVKPMMFPTLTDDPAQTQTQTQMQIETALQN